MTSGGAYVSDGDKWGSLDIVGKWNKIISIYKSGKNYYAGASQGGIYKIQWDNTWVKEPDENIAGKIFTAFWRGTTRVYAGSSGGEVFETGVNVSLWKKSATLPDGLPGGVKITTFFNYNDGLYIGTDGGGIYSMDGKQMNSGLTNTFIRDVVNAIP